MFLQTYVVPVCLYNNDGGRAQIKELIGTAFFINDQGIFLTATHVMNSAHQKSVSNEWMPALVVKGEKGTKTQSFATNIISFNPAPSPFDISIGKVNYTCNTMLAIQDLKISEWQDITTYGYPLHAVKWPPSFGQPEITLSSNMMG